MDMKKIAVAIVALFAIVCILPAADAADINNTPSGTQKFDNMKGGDINFNVESDSVFTMTVTVYENFEDSVNKKVVAQKEFEIVVGTNAISIHISDPSPGMHQYRVICEPAGEFPAGQNGFPVTADVSKNVLSNWVTYAVIILVVIVIAVFAYLKIRDTPKNKPEMTFEELEAQRKAEMAEKGQKKQSKSTAKTTERQKYLANKKKKE